MVIPMRSEHASEMMFGKNQYAKKKSGHTANDELTCTLDNAIQARESNTFDTLVYVPPFSFQFVQVSVGMYALLEASHRNLEELVISHGYQENMRSATFQSLHSEDVAILPRLKRLR